MALENLYFKHELNARNDPKLLKIRKNLGYEGIGVYWCLIEMLYEKKGHLTEEELDNICWSERIEKEILTNVLNYGDFKQDDKGYYSEGVIKRIDKREEYCLKQKGNAKKRWSKTTTKDKPTEEKEEIQPLFDKVYDKIKNPFND